MRIPLARSVFALLVAVTLVLFLTPVEQVPHAPDDKLVHLLTFVVLALCGRWAQLATVPLGVGLTAYAALTEGLQAVLPIGRHGDLLDLIADVAGVLVGLVLVRATTALASRVPPSGGGQTDDPPGGDAPVRTR